jgi:hypothetical protein
MRASSRKAKQALHSYFEAWMSNPLWLAGLVVIVIGASLCRILSWNFMLNSWAENGVPISDARALDMWALNILDGLGYRDIGGFWLYEAFRMPFFSVVLATLYALFGYFYLPVRVVLTVLSVVTCLGVAGVGRLLFNRKVGFLAGFLYAFYCPMIYYAIAYMTETLFAFLLVLGVYMFLRAVHERSWGFVIGSGIALGLAGMTRFVAFVTIPVMGLYLLTHSSSWNRKLWLGVLWTTVIIVSFSPWVIRNALVFHAFFPSESGGTRQMWTSANPEYNGVHYTRDSRRIILWTDPEASEIERNKRLQRETREFIRENPVWYLNSMEWRASHYLATPTWKEATRQEDFYQRWSMIATWIAAWFGSAGFILAIAKRMRSGFFITSIFLFLVALHSLAGELTRYRLTSEWLWCIGVAYTLFCMSRISTHSFFVQDEEISSAPPLRRRGIFLPPFLKGGEGGIYLSIFDHRLFQWGIPIVLLIPFVVLAIKIPINRAQLRHQKLPELPRPVMDMVVDAGLEEQFNKQGNVLHDVSYYIQHAKKQTAPRITYPNHVIIYTGELSHFILRPADGSIKSFSFKVNKAGLHIGDLVAFCEVSDQALLFLPKKIKRTQGIIVGVISGTGGGSGEPSFLISDIYLNHEGNWMSCRKFETRTSKLETISNHQNSKFKT